MRDASKVVAAVADRLLKGRETGDVVGAIIEANRIVEDFARAHLGAWMAENLLQLETRVNIPTEVIQRDRDPKYVEHLLDRGVADLLKSARDICTVTKDEPGSHQSETYRIRATVMRAK